ncbi:hypothetical protein FJY90_06880, partial [Candidatus Gottesmanbacteria bacterium]|nr:hypothetical protein [Candidatus Gottesmanbacteria bacterium]
MRISRTAYKRLKSDFRHLVRFLEISYPEKKDNQPLTFLSSQTINNFARYFLKRTNNPKHVQTFVEVLKQFRSFLETKIHFFVTEEETSSTLQSLVVRFLSDLKKHQAPSSTLRNYKSDLVQFFHFLSVSDSPSFNKFLQTALPASLPPALVTLESFSNYLRQELHLSLASIKRKQSSVRSFFSWMVKKGFLYQLPLPEEKESKRFSIFNFFPRLPLNRYFAWAIGTLMLMALGVGIYQQFFYRAPKLVAVPTQPTRPGRILNFQGRITDASENAISDPKKLQFRIWDAASGGTVLYQTDICNIVPDQNGIFSLLIGNGSNDNLGCGKEIPQSVFSENMSTYLGITVESDTEMTPRQQIATVGYAINAETLQGLPPTSPAGPMNIPYVDANGRLLIKAVSPILKSVTGKFTIEGLNLILQTTKNSNGSIELAPDGKGSVDFKFSGLSPAENKGFTNIIN